MFQRTLAKGLLKAAKGFRVLTVMGPRQSGKTTLVRTVFPKKKYVNLENPDMRAAALHDPKSFLAAMPDGGIIDEVLRAPDLLSYIQGIVDETNKPGMFILTGSKQLLLMKSISQSLAGRTSIHELLPLGLTELASDAPLPASAEEWVWHGMFPGTFKNDVSWENWHRSYVRTYVERDVRDLNNIADLARFQDFLALCAGRTGQLLNLSSLAGDCGIAPNTARAWIGVLEASFVAWRLRPYHANVIKQRTRAPKLHFYDTGLACFLLGITSPAMLRTHPLRGALFETAVVNEFLKERLHSGRRNDLLFYRDRSRREADLIIPTAKEGMDVVEMKSGSTWRPEMMRGVAAVRTALPKTRKTIVVYGGNERWDMKDGTVIGWKDVPTIKTSQ